MYFTVQLDFVTQIITNSSSVVYSYADDNAFKQFVNALFKEVGIDKTCDDVFDLYVLPTNMDMIVGDEENEELQGLLKGLSWSEKNKVAEKYVLEQIMAGKELDYGEDVWTGVSNPTRLLVCTKNGQFTELGKMVANVFDHSATYDG